MMTLYVIPCDNPEQSDIQRLKQSAKDVCDVIHVLEHRRLHEVEPETEWYGYLFSNEWLDGPLTDALPIFFEDTKYDYLVLYKKVQEDLHGVVTPKMYVAPRFFRSYVKLESDGNLIPKDPEKLSFVQVLDGWIMEPTRKLQ